MYLGAVARRFSGRRSRAIGLVSTIVLLCTAAGSYGTAAASTPYPPAPTCALSWSAGDGQDTSGRAVLVGSGYDSNRAVALTAYPQARALGSVVTNSAGAFEVPVDTAATADSSWLTARTLNRTCSVAPPSSSAPSAAPSDTAPGSAPSDSAPGTTPSGTAPSVGGSRTTAPTRNSLPAGAVVGGPPAGAATGATAGAGSGGSASTGGTGSTRSAYPPTGASATPSGSAPSTSGTAPSTPAGQRSPSTPSRADTSSPSTLGLPLSVIVTIAALLLLAGGLAVLFLTRRAN